MSIAAETIFLDGRGPYPVVRPGSTAELSDLVWEAITRGEAVFPIGGQTLVDYGLPPSQPGLALDMRGLQRLIDYPAADMTVTVEAGLTLGELQRILGEAGQWLPLDAPLSERTTLGGALATNLPGPRRYGYGTWRDYVLGMSVVNDRGELTRSGGRVVKNVAGYDLHKLHIGALGTLGVIVEVTFKVRPLPEARALVCYRCRDDMLAAVLDQLHLTATRPVTMSVVNPRAAALCEPLRGWAEPETALVLIGFEEKRTTVTWQLHQLQQELARCSGVEYLGQWWDEGEVVWQWLADFPLLPSPQVSFRASVLPSQTAYVLKAAKHLGELACVAHAGSGTVYGHWWEVDQNSLLQYLDALRSTAAALSRMQAEHVAAPGRVVVLRCPIAWKTPLLLWGEPATSDWLQRKIKEAFDPQGRFNPGRFPAGW
ncbi:putative FAD-linked oxidoreductase [bacterium HR36]|nr:putative FAD-linked oxidoreductase [bacterium HR36]